MSKTIRNERTRGFLDKLQKQRQTRKLIRDMKSFDLMAELFPDEQQFAAES